MFSFTKIVLPLVTLPYLARILSVETYGVVAYTRSLMGYFQLFIDFGFVLSGTKKIVVNKGDKNTVNQIIGSITLARVLLALLSVPVLIIISICMPIYEGYLAYLFISFIPVCLSIFLFDFVFRGIEKMGVLTMRFFIMKGVAVAMTFIFVHGDEDLLILPLLDVIGSFIAIIFVIYNIKKEGYSIKCKSIGAAFLELKESSIYFASNFSQTFFSILNTIVIGTFLKASDVAFWSICIQIVTAVQTMYQPITDGIYPRMMATKDIKILKKILIVFMPIIGGGCLFTLIVAKYALIIIGGMKYAGAATVLRLLVPVMFFGFPCILFGWPTLGAINKDKYVTISTIIGAAIQLTGLIMLGIIGQFNLINIAICRSITEIVLLTVRFVIYSRYKKVFSSLVPDTVKKQ